MVVAALPGVMLARWVPDAQRARHLNVLVSSVGVLAALRLLPLVGTSLAECLIVRLVDVPCPFCGVTRSVSSLLHGDLVTSFDLHPMGAVLVAAFAFQIALRANAVLARRTPLLATPRADGRFDLVVIVGCVVTQALRALELV